MLDPNLRDRVNDVLERLFAPDDTVANVRAFCSLLEDLNRRNLTIVQEPHVTAIHIVRAGSPPRTPQRQPLE